MEEPHVTERRVSCMLLCALGLWQGPWNRDTTNTIVPIQGDDKVTERLERGPKQDREVHLCII